MIQKVEKKERYSEEKSLEKMRDRQLEQSTFVKKQIEYEEKVRKPLVQEEARAARVREKIEQKDLKVETILNENEKLKRDVSH